ncbi:MAG: putative toxin-antitoxin system toxin component, PIN family [Bacteroidales bacterium]|jgi:putative PIN family toxin of toxin-antitoxin system|nr:putative toxin-antitoxin system toxin component, PIN family [Bacteroidales bacterium]
MKKKSRVIVDTNIWISFLISKSLGDLDKPILNGKIVLLFSHESMTEFIDVTSREKLKPFFTDEDIAALIDLIEEYGEIVKINSQVQICRDTKDNFLLALAKDGKADYLVTGDKDLLILESFEKTKITNLTDFRELYK